MNTLAFYQFNEEFFTKRAERLTEIYRQDDIKLVEFDIKFDGPEYGWLDVYLYLDGKEAFVFETSEVYPPFSDIREWLEDMLHYYTVPSKSFIVDCERYHVIFSYDYIGFLETKSTNAPLVFIQIGYDCSEMDGGKVIQFIIPIQSFVTCFYRKLKDYLYENRKVFRKYWNLPGNSDFDIRKLMRSFVSKTIENELSKEFKRL